jgi:hypothetical protein
MNLLRREGAATLTSFPYSEHDCTTLPNAATKQAARAFAIADWRRVNVQDEMEIKTQIASGFPVLIGMVVDNAFSQLGPGQIYSGPPGQSRGGHAMVVVGYSDARSAFKVINSWGTNWGDQGFGWISYNVFRQTVREAYTAQDIVINSPVTPPSPPPPPPPVSHGPRISLGFPTIVHNVLVPSSSGMQNGMQIHVPGQVSGAAGRSLQVIVKFNYFNGPPLHANPSETIFRDSAGLVITGTPLTPVATNSESTNQLQMSIPYYALNFAPTGGQANLNLSLTVIALIDNQPLAQSSPVQFGLRW